MSRSGSIITFWGVCNHPSQYPLTLIGIVWEPRPSIRHSLEWWSGILGKVVSAGHYSKSKWLPVSIPSRPSREQVLEDETKAEYYIGWKRIIVFPTILSWKYLVMTKIMNHVCGQSKFVPNQIRVPTWARVESGYIRAVFQNMDKRSLQLCIHL